jgi:hypothetical protein
VGLSRSFIYCLQAQPWPRDCNGPSPLSTLALVIEIELLFLGIRPVLLATLHDIAAVAIVTKCRSFTLLHFSSPKSLWIEAG